MTGRHPVTVLCLVHDDGHVGGIASKPPAEAGLGGGGRPLTEGWLRRHHALMREVGIRGWRLARLPLGDAVDLAIAGEACQRCRVRLPCGCEAALVAAGGCPHGSAEAIRAAALKVGYR